MKKIILVLSTLTISFGYSQTQPWNTTGNSGTNSATDFIGTTDNQPLILKTANTEKLRITPSGRFIVPRSELDPNFPGVSYGSLFFGGGNDASLDRTSGNAIFGINSFISNTEGWSNTVFGTSSLVASTDGIGNTVMGLGVLKNSKSPSSNVAIGIGTMSGYERFVRNTVIGASALSSTRNPPRGIDIVENVAVGSSSLSRLLIGNYNVAIGSYSLYDLSSNNGSSTDTSKYSSNIGIGYYAGQGLWEGNNNIFIGNKVKASSYYVSDELNIGNWIFGRSGDIGIGTNNPQERFEISGKSDNDSGLRFTKLNSNSPTTPHTKLLGVDAQGKVVLAENSGDGSGNSWGLTGNAGTNPSTNFIGTTDDNPIIFKQNNQQVFKLEGQSINIGSGVSGTGNLQLALSPCNSCFSQWAQPNDAVMRLLSGRNLNIHMDNDNATDPNSDTSTPNSPGITRIRFSDAVHKNLLVLFNTGKVAIGTDQYDNDSKYRLYVKDGIKAERVKVEVASANGWADYVFKKDYPLMPLSEVEKHIQDKGHLPNIPSADEVVKNGVDLGEMNSKLLQKIEELTLYQIQMSKDIKELKEENRRLKDTMGKE
ncbi:hypothetical protein [Chryseobacterium sp. PMSZPI]|uniref:hypothetical protein n=1 Tax=Chryseobacterium sp. PMSZPI TaxID=1033900 RepID=UPI000C3312C7|nr:hypothetical protein [Chryseobacterium sp. PMSZPI]PKF73648.1 hypothetical protein CW752_13215 [Chryseobacterium sp. PMSZPI]